MWDELLQSVIFGKKVTYNNEEYFIIHSLEKDFYLTVKAKSEYPAQVYLLKVENIDIKS
ncbi:MAG: hypothetical protein LLF98_02545 [Clostridium sp.]|uniref:hypothetical protein n=1 Tax=Clostridium sp. TaxID=1506 RepID=UPI0025C15ED5|nr:hypothetical protein [Clostridium sp.]MCE5220162.1 hypothetical protein [Clostridium sp.]